MRISDWSSDVCSSDLLPVILPAIAARVKMDHLEAERMGPVRAAGAYAPAVAETHSGVVFFAGDRAYKLKKDVDLAFLDFSSRVKRLAACRRVVELNRRLVTDVYLGASDVPDATARPLENVVV